MILEKDFCIFEFILHSPPDRDFHDKYTKTQEQLQRKNALEPTQNQKDFHFDDSKGPYPELKKKQYYRYEKPSTGMKITGGKEYCQNKGLMGLLQRTKNKGRKDVYMWPCTSFFVREGGVRVSEGGWGEKLGGPLGPVNKRVSSCQNGEVPNP